MKNHAALAIAALIGAAALGCASTSASRPREYRGSVPRPAMILVYDFAVNAGDVAENQAFFHQAWEAAASDETASERADDIGREVANAMAREIVAGIRDLGLPAQRATRNQRMPAHAIAITGEFLNVDEGNRLQRLVIGFGAGQAQVQTRVRAVQPMRDGPWRTLTEFTTTADSGYMPGAAVTMGAGAAAQGAVTGGAVAATAATSGVKAYRSQVEQMASRSADEAVDQLEAFFARQGWIARDR
jgi:hypothetical protein